MVVTQVNEVRIERSLGKEEDSVFWKLPPGLVFLERSFP